MRRVERGERRGREERGERREERGENDLTISIVYGAVENFSSSSSHFLHCC